RQLEERRVNRRVYANRLAALQQEIARERDALQLQEKSRPVAQAEWQAQLAEAEARLQLAQNQSERTKKLWDAKVVPMEDLERAAAEVAAQQAGRAALQRSHERQELDR